MSEVVEESAPAGGGDEREPPIGPRVEHLARDMRGSLGSLRAAAESLEQFPDMALEHRHRLYAVLSDEARRLGDLVDRLGELARELPRSSHGYRLTAGALLEALATALGERGLDCAALPTALPVTVTIDSGMVVAAAELMAELRRRLAFSRCALESEHLAPHLLIDICWQSPPAEVEGIQPWSVEALDSAEPALRPLVREHGGEAWLHLGRGDGSVRLRLLLPAEPDGGSAVEPAGLGPAR